MTDEAAFLAALAAGPDDAQLPLVFADWLDDRDDPRGPWVRDPVVRPWMGPTFQSPVPALLRAVARGKDLRAARRAAGAVGGPLVPGLVELLGHAAPRVRRHVCACLQAIGEPARAAVPALLTALGDADRRVRRAAAAALAGVGANEPAGSDRLTAALSDPDAEVRRLATGAVGAMGASGGVLEHLLGRYESPDPGDRAAAVAALAQLGTADVIPHLEAAVGDPDGAVRVAAVRALGRVRRADVGPALCRAALAPDADVREAAADQFAGSDWVPPFTPDVLAALAPLLRDAAGRVRAAACRALGRAGPAAAPALPALIGLLVDPEVRAAAAAAVGLVGRDDPGALAAVLDVIGRGELPPASAALYPLLDWTRLPTDAATVLLGHLARVRADGEYWTDVVAVYRLFGKLDAPTPGVLAELRAALRDENFSFPWWVADALGRFGPAAAGAVPELEALVRRNAPGTHEAVAALCRLGEQGTAAVAAVLTDGPALVREHMSYSLRNVGATGLPLLPTLLGLLRGPDPEWRGRAIGLIRCIGPDAEAAIPALLELAGHHQLNYSWAALEAMESFGARLVPYLPDVAALARRHTVAAAPPGIASLAPAVAKVVAGLAAFTPDVLEPLRALVRANVPVEGEFSNDRWDKQAVRQTAAAGLALLGPAAAPAVPELAEVLRDGTDDGRLEAARALAATGSPAAVPALRQAAADPSEAVRLTAVAGLGTLGDAGDETLAALVRATEDPGPVVRRAAVDALGRLKAGTAPVRTALASAARDPDKRVAARAAVALRKVAPKPPPGPAAKRGKKAD